MYYYYYPHLVVVLQSIMAYHPLTLHVIAPCQHRDLQIVTPLILHLQSLTQHTLQRISSIL